jgi:hypothetical protein
MSSIDDRITVGGAGSRERSTHLDADALGLTEELVPAAEWRTARPTGVGRAISTYTIPIEGRDEWLAAARRLA